MQIEQYKQTVVAGIFQRIPATLKRLVCNRAQDVEKIISLQKDGHQEWDMPYPNFVPKSWSEYYEDNAPTGIAIEELTPQVVNLLNVHASQL
jgi:hypothetical protein